MPLLLPSDQDFEVIPWLGTPGGGATHTHWPFDYLNFYPFGHISSGTYPASARTGYLSTYLPGFTTGASCSHSAVGGISDTSLRCFAPAWVPSVDCIARASFVRRCTNSSTGAQVAGGFRGGAIFNRIGGTYGTVEGLTFDPADTTAHNAEYADCYALWVHPLSTAPNADLWFHVFGITHSSASGSSGTLRELAVHKLTGGMSLVDSAAAFDASLEVVTDAGDVKVRARVHVITGGGQKIAATLFATTVLGGTVTLGTDVTASSGGVLTDAHTNKITSGNGVGWGMYSTRTDTVSSVSVNVIEGIASFKVSNASTGQTLFEDDFTRAVDAAEEINQTSIFRRITDGLGNDGAWLNGGWSYGATANVNMTANDVDPLMLQTETGTTSFDGTDYLAIRTSLIAPSTTQPTSRPFYSTRPADYDYSQNRSIEFKPFDHQVGEAAWTAAVDRYGVLLRCTVVQGAVSTAFAAWAEPTFTDSSGLTQTGLIVRFGVRIEGSIDGAPTYLVMWSKTVAGVDLIDGAWHSIAYDMHVVESSTDTNGAVLHEVKLDGSTIVFDTPGAYAAGTTVLTDGRVVDSGTLGPGYKTAIEGFFFESSVPETDSSSNVLRNAALMRRWRQGTLTVLESTTPPEQMAPYMVPFADEVNTAASGDLSTVCDATFPVQVSLTSSSPIQAQGGKGHTSQRNRATRSRHAFQFETGPMDETGRAALLAFWSARKRSTPFNFDLTHDRAFSVYFAEAPRFHFDAPNGWRASISLIQRLA